MTRSTAITDAASTTPRLFVTAALRDNVEIAASPGQAHYLGTVLRRASGDVVRLFNGADGEWVARLNVSRRDRIALIVERRQRPQTLENGPWLLFAPLKRDATDLLVRQAVELGASRLLPVITDRTTASRVNDERLALIATEAAEQSERLTVPVIDPPSRLAGVLAAWPAGRRLFAAIERTWPGAPPCSGPGPAALLIGPEGGLTQAEQAMLRGLDFVTPISLGPFVLRAETAAAAGQALLLGTGWAEYFHQPETPEHRMSNPADGDATPITSLRQLAEHIAQGCKPRDQFGIGTEHEKFGFRHADLKTPPYEPSDGQPGCIRDLLRALERFDATPILDHGNTIGLKQGGASVSLEPAGQLELSGRIAATLHETKAEFDTHFDQVRAASRGLDIGFAPLGFHPLARREDMPWMPKGRYAIMRRYMPLVGGNGLDMMTRTCTVQVNLDYESERDMVRKSRVSLILQPLATALFANSPFTHGRENGFLSYRAHVWTDTDNQRSGIPRAMLDPGFGFEPYVTWLVDQVPMYFVYRNGGYIDVAGASFRDFMNGAVPVLDGITPTLGDFADHMTTAFTDVRVKQFLEMRGADAGTAEMMLAQSALWVGLLYDEAALAAAEALTRGLGWEDAMTLREAVPRLGLAVPFRNGTLRDLARDVVAIAGDGLRARGRRDKNQSDESVYLDPLRDIAAGAPVQAEFWLDRNKTVWNGDVRNIFAEAAI